MTDLYEAGDINQTDAGDDAADVNRVEPGDSTGEAGEGNERRAVDGGTPLAVLTYLARARPRSAATGCASTCTWPPRTWAG